MPAAFDYRGDAHALPTALYRCAQVRELDRIAIDEEGIVGFTLMERAGQAAFEALRERWPAAQRVIVLCGSGNNGGDGYIVARLARAAGLGVEAFELPGARAPSGDALRARRAYEADGGRVDPFSPDALREPALIVDALLGTGLERPVSGAHAELIDAINASGLPVIALDVPSGLDADAGMALGTAVRAELTVTFVGLKLGLFGAGGAEHAGELRFAGLGIPERVYQRLEPAARRLAQADLAQALEPRRRGAHKGEFGHVMVVGGEQGMSGAARMAAEAAARVGAGLVSIATRAAHAESLAVARPELMCHAVEDAGALRPLLARASVVAIGPGLGRGEWGRRMLEAVLGEAGARVVDADALNLLAERQYRCEDWILTPHPGEAGRLLGCPAAEIERDRAGSVAALQARYGGVAVLKGAGTLVCDGSTLQLCAAGNPGMASGGQGDVLTGVIAGLLAQGLAPACAAGVGVYLHAAAGDAAAADGERGMLAGDLFPHLRRLANPGRA